MHDRFAFLLLLIALVLGCSRAEYEIAEVQGELVIQGQPGSRVHIEFIPDAGVAGPTSAADTDDQGMFTLHIMSRDGSSPVGAVVGNHRVTLSDRRLSESADGRGVRLRFGQEYTLFGSTPLKQEIKPGSQVVQLKIP